MAEQAGPVDDSAEREISYLFRGDDDFRSGPIGLALGREADSASIQNFADHVLRKEKHRSSRFTSFSEEVKVARRFTSADDNRNVFKINMSRLRELESQGIIRIWTAEEVFVMLKDGPKKLAKQAADVRTAMKRSSEILIEGQIPAEFLERTN